MVVPGGPELVNDAFWIHLGGRAPLDAELVPQVTVWP